MALKIEISIHVIVHATEDISKIFQSFEDVLDVQEEDFTIQETEGHYENPIIMLNANIGKKQAQNFMNVLLESLPDEQVNKLIEEIEDRTEDSRFHLRLDKQELIKGNLVIQEKGTIKIKIHTPIYNKKDTIKIFSKIFQIAN
ncbi:RNA-binding domain-containing protein [Nitrosopumilus sp.]|uniref:RNA-binding domain-containing protein n=1 Tax=Nitrosopumilus sp. TaxID=2024843 RepID=UPI00247DE3F6|nr:RNA-binding domain-containing protein [Nitrosopumilus sp.]MCV0431050.1 exosome protein [Nitrosopumilus sp.]